MWRVHTLGGVFCRGGAPAAADGEARRAGVRRPVIVGVTVLTSLSGADIEGIFGRTMDVADVVIMLAGRAREAGLDGVVASVGETLRIKREIGGSCVVVTPGIRPANRAIRSAWPRRGRRPRPVPIISWWGVRSFGHLLPWMRRGIFSMIFETGSPKSC